jgi:dTDP-glucose 4,6-dehydratase
LVFKKGDVVTATIPFSVTHVLHFATTPANQSDESLLGEMRATIVAGTKRMLEEAERVGAKRFLLASSGAVYGRENSNFPSEALVEASTLPAVTDLSDPLNGGVTVYGAAKREAERLCFQAQQARRIETIVARGFAFSGPLFPLEGPYAISGFMSAMLKGLPLNVRSPQTIRAYLDGRDLVHVLWMLLARGRSGEAYNVGGAESVTMHELADLVRAVALKVGRKVPEVRVATPMMQGPDTYRPSLKKLEAEFGWHPTITLRESLRDHALWATQRSK